MVGPDDRGTPACSPLPRAPTARNRGTGRDEPPALPMGIKRLHARRRDGLLGFIQCAAGLFARLAHPRSEAGCQDHCLVHESIRPSIEQLWTRNGTRGRREKLRTAVALLADKPFRCEPPAIDKL